MSGMRLSLGRVAGAGAPGGRLTPRHEVHPFADEVEDHPHLCGRPWREDEHVRVEARLASRPGVTFDPACRRGIGDATERKRDMSAPIDVNVAYLSTCHDAFEPVHSDFGSYPDCGCARHQKALPLLDLDQREHPFVEICDRRRKKDWIDLLVRHRPSCDRCGRRSLGNREERDCVTGSWCTGQDFWNPQASNAIFASQRCRR